MPDDCCNTFNEPCCAGEITSLVMECGDVRCELPLAAVSCGPFGVINGLRFEARTASIASSGVRVV